jgi:hypothetical protein
LLVDFYHLFGYLSGLLLARPGMEPNSLYLTAALVHFLDAGLCCLIATHSGRRSLLWALGGLIFGIWALGLLFLLPVKKPERNP